MREIGAKGQIDDASIIQYIISGIHDIQQNKILLYGATDFKTFKVKLDVYKNFKEGMQHSKCSEPGQSRPNFRKPLDRCYSCGSLGHKAVNCKKLSLGTKCFNCKEFGHKAPECPKKQRQSNCAKSINRCVNGTNSALKDVVIEGKTIRSLIDTGSDLTLMRADVYIKTGSPTLIAPGTSVKGLSDTPVETLGAFNTDIIIDDQLFSSKIHVLPERYLNSEVLIGRDVLEGTNISLKDGQVFIQKHENPTVTSYFCDELNELNVGVPSYKSQIAELVENYKPCEGNVAEFELKILLKDETPIQLKPRRLAPQEKDAVDKQVCEWLEKEIIQPSTSEFPSPVVLVDKKDGSKRLCVDYRQLNKRVIRDRFPLPLIEDQLDQLQGARIFSTLDLENGFFHVPIARDSRKYTSFVTPSGQYEFLRMPFGLCVSPTVFQRYINMVFRALVKKKFLLIYMDDIVVLANSEEEAMERLKETLSVAAANGLRIKWKKCQFLSRQIEYLGYEISAGRLRPSDTKINAVRKFPEPTDTKKLQSFLGLSGYFRKFVPNYAEIAKPLSDLLKKGSEWHFGPLQRDAFARLKDALVQKPALLIYDPTASTELHTDASKFGYGAILLQKSSDDQCFHPVMYYSRKTNSAQENYSSYELEVLAIISALKKMRVYLLGIKFKIVTDCVAFKMTMNKKDVPPRIARWALYLQDFNYEIEHRPGSRMKHVDALSRCPISMVVSNDFILQMKNAQMKDENLRVIAGLAEAGNFEDYTVEKGILYKEKDGLKLLCVPRSMQRELIKSVHDQGHFGIRKMEEILAREYFIPKLKEKLENCRQNCIPCILAERKGGKQEGWLHPLPKAEYPLECYHVDHLGPLTTTRKNYKYTLTVIDSFSKFTWIYPVKTLTSDEAITKLEQQKNIFGSPKQLISDRGTAFTSRTFEGYCQREKINHTLITTGVPRGNGQVERIHRVIISVLTKLAMENPDEWYKYTGKVQRYLNSSWQRSIGKTPFEVMFGTRMRNPEDAHISEIISEEILKLFDAERDELREQAKKNILKIQEENKKGYNRKRCKPKEYQVGDLVAIKRTQFGNALKIQPKFLGPYRVSRVNLNDRYDVVKIGNNEGPRATTVSADNMKQWTIFDDTYSSSEDQGDSEDEVAIDNATSTTLPSA